MSNLVRRRSFLSTMLAAGVLSRPALSEPPTALEVGILPNISARMLLAQYQPMRKFLAGALHRPVQLSTAPSWSIFQQRTLALDYDVVVTAAHMARVAQLDSGLVPLLSYAPDIKGMIAFDRDRPLKSVAELAGQTLVVSNPQSLVTLHGMHWLADKGLKRDRDFATINTPTDDSVGSVVVRGDAIAAMLSGGEYRAIPDAIKAQLQILVTFAEVAGFVVLASPKLPPVEARAIKEHLLHFAAVSEEGKTFFANTGFTSIREPVAGLMESMDAYVETTRQMMSQRG